ncbi:MAG: site-2 protease family protein [Planctomycetota bacterium]
MPDLEMLLLRIPNLLVALTLHEFCHAYMAYRCGDPTPKFMGRLTLNPLSHLDPIGTICILFAPIGWAKPVPVNPYNFRHPSRDDILVSLAGPFANLSIAIIIGSTLRVLTITNIAIPIIALKLLGLGVVMNIGLILFNLIPVYPLDGHHVLRELLPSYKAKEKYEAFNRIAPFLLLAIIVFAPGLLWQVLAPPISAAFWLFTGMNFDGFMRILYYL